MTIQETIKQLNILLSRERYLLGCSSDEHQHSQMIEALEVAKRAVEELRVKHGLISEGVIDVGYTGSICVKLYNHSPKDYIVEQGDKISQLVILPIVAPNLDLVDRLEHTKRGNGGFGSTGR